MKAITPNELQEMLSTTKGATIVSILARTPVKLRKKSRVNSDPCPFESIHKISRVNGILNHNYEKSVNRQREREGKETDFQAVQHQWAEHVPGTPFVRNRRGGDTLYLVIKVERAFDTVYVDQDDRIRTKQEIAEFEYSKGSSRQNLDQEVIYRNYKLDNIHALIMKGETFVVTR